MNIEYAEFYGKEAKKIFIKDIDIKVIKNIGINLEFIGGKRETRVYFDWEIDQREEKLYSRDNYDNFHDQITHAILKNTKKYEYVVSDGSHWESQNDWKVSFHIIFPQLKMYKHLMKKTCPEFEILTRKIYTGCSCMSYGRFVKFMDGSVYGEKLWMRLPYATFTGKPYPHVILDDANYGDFILNAIDDCKWYHIKEEEIIPERHCTEEEHRYLKTLMEFIPKERILDNPKEWHYLLLSCHNWTGGDRDGLVIFDEWTNNNFEEQYDGVGLENKWKNCKQKKNGLGIKYVEKLVEIINPVEFKIIQIEKKQKKLENMIAEYRKQGLNEKLSEKQANIDMKLMEKEAKQEEKKIIHEEYELEPIPHIRIKIDYDDPYTFHDFEKELLGSEFQCRQHAIDFLVDNLPRVLAISTQGSGLFLKKDRNNLMSYLELRHYFSGINVFYYAGKNKLPVLGKFGNLSEIIPTFKGHIFYRDVDFLPMEEGIEEETHEIFNLWSGFKARLITKPNYENPSLIKLLRHIRTVWASDNDEYYNYIMYWLKMTLKHPEKKLDKALVIFGNEGTGKNLIIEFIMRYVIGDKLVYQADDLESFAGKFNSFLEGRKLVIIGEISSKTSDFHCNWGRVKNRISNPTINIERKGKEPKSINDFSNLILFSNHTSGIKISAGDRRFPCFWSSDYYKGNTAYFNEMFSKDVFNQDIGNLFYTYMLLSDDIKEVDLRQIPETDLRKDIQDVNKNTGESFIDDIRERLKNGWVPDKILHDTEIVGNTLIIKACKLFEFYCEWCTNNREKESPKRIFGNMICKLNGIEDKTKNFADKKYRIKIITF